MASGARAGEPECTCEATVVCPPAAECARASAPQAAPAPEAAPPYAPYATPSYGPPYRPYWAPPPPDWAPPPYERPTTRAEPVAYRRPRLSVIGGGAGLFALSWGVPAAQAWISHYGKLAIPLAGPILLGQEAGGAYLMPALVLDVIAQAGGLITVLVGVLTTEKVYVHAPPKVTVAPAVSPAFSGLAVAGRF